MKKTLSIFGGVVGAAVLIGAWVAWGPSHAPAGQPPLVSLDAANFTQLQKVFNDDAGKIRVVALLSPT